MTKRLSRDDFQDQIDMAATKAAVIFRAFGWTWSDEQHPPSESQIVKALEKHVARVLKDGGESWSGRFGVILSPMASGQFHLNIVLELAEKTTHEEQRP